MARVTRYNFPFVRNVLHISVDGVVRKKSPRDNMVLEEWHDV